MTLKTCLRALVYVCLLAAMSLAQTGTGNIQGTVKDVSGAIVPGAKVTLLRVDTNETTNTETNEVGFFLFPAQRIGAYEVTVEMSGMAAWKGTVNLIQGQ